VRCLLIAPSDLELSAVATVLADEGVEVEQTSDIGAGAALARVNLDRFDCCIAVVPAGHRDASMSMAAIYVEIGVAAARRLPLLVVVQAPAQPSPALAGLTTATSSLDNVEALRLHLSLFLRSVASGVPPETESNLLPTAPNLVSAGYRRRLEMARTSHDIERALAFERLVTDIVRAAGAKIEERPTGWPDTGVDIAAFIPGEEQRLGPLLIEVKSGLLTAADLVRAQQKLSDHVLQTRSGLGLLIFNEIAVGARKVAPAPLVARIGIDQLLSELEARPLSEVLVQARGRAVHWM
jgi:hypothetical protein